MDAKKLINLKERTDSKIILKDTTNTNKICSEDNRY